MLKKYIPYGRQSIDQSDVDSVIQVLRSDWLTTGPKVEEFEKSFCDYSGAENAVAVSSGTAGLHAAIFAAGIKKGDEVIVSSMTFAASANCIVYQSGTPVFADVLPDTLLINPEHVEKLITKNTKAIISVDYAGQPADYDALRLIADRYGLLLIADACHSIGGKYKGRNVGTLADMNIFSFHPVKHITTGEGGMVTAGDKRLIKNLKIFRNHGISTDHRQRSESGSWFYEMTDLGYNYRITDFQCALGISQLKKLNNWVLLRQDIAYRYDNSFKDNQAITPLNISEDVQHAFHLYVVKMKFCADRTREDLFVQMKHNKIGINVHYIPVHLHPYYMNNFKTHEGQCPVSEKAYNEIVSIPMYPTLSPKDQNIVIEKLIGYFN